MATIQERFERFHSQNPHVYEHLKRLALKAVDAGHEKLGIAQLFEVCRWELLLTTTDRAPVLNNDFRAPFARLLMEREPALRGVFYLRRSAVDSSAPHSPEPGPPPAEGPSVAAGSGQPAATPSSDRRQFSTCGRNGGSDVEGAPRAVTAPGLPSEPHPSSLFEVEPTGPAWADSTNPYRDAA